MTYILQVFQEYIYLFTTTCTIHVSIIYLPSNTQDAHTRSPV